MRFGTKVVKVLKSGKVVKIVFKSSSTYFSNCTVNNIVELESPLKPLVSIENVMRGNFIGEYFTIS